MFISTFFLEADDNQSLYTKNINFIPVRKRRTAYDGTWDERGKAHHIKYMYHSQIKYMDHSQIERILPQVSQTEYDSWKGSWDAAGVLLKGREEALDK